MATQIRHTETVDGARARLARKARQQGVSLRIDAQGNWFANSVSTPGREYFVTALSCQCTGFVSRQRCIHNSAVLVALGLLEVEDDDPEPTPPATPGMAVTVIHNRGVYSLPGLGHAGGVWQEPTTTIFVDREPLLRIEGDDSDVRVWWLEQGCAVEEATHCAGHHSHYEAARNWVLGMAANIPAATLLQEAGLFPSGEFIDESEVA